MATPLGTPRWESRAVKLIVFYLVVENWKFDLRTLRRSSFLFQLKRFDSAVMQYNAKIFYKTQTIVIKWDEASECNKRIVIFQIKFLIFDNKIENNQFYGSTLILVSQRSR